MEFNKINKTKPSSIASYNWEGCLGKLSIAGKITPHDTFVTLPTSSPLIKLAIRPKNIPIGDTHAMISSRKKVGTFFFKEN